MAQVLVRNLNEKVVARLKKRAEQRGRSLQAEVKEILEQAAGRDPVEIRRTVERVRRMLGDKRFSDSAALIREDRSR